ncbi:phytanoyl-CoA dioxygenase family protein [Nocardia miyunensis]|uniref:phytanoyl-CoA dioxygenase family protein n=1 Tax=Nocardia miyunensis TaxID=282684 RepID=UPI0008354E9C|nr:phytanoyl-CoA dioxygenase family protein [Nocardia miyunensis]
MSSRVLARWGSARDQLEADGFCLLRQLLPGDTSREIGAEVTAALVGARLSDGSETASGQPAYLERTDSIVPPDLAGVARSEILEKLFHTPEFLECAASLLTIDIDDLFVHPNKYLRAVPPIESDLHYPAGVHQDYPELQGSLRQLAFWIPFFQVDSESGTLPVYPTGGVRRILPLTLADNPSGWATDGSCLPHPVVAELAPGDALVFHTLTPHGGSENRGAGWRASVECRVQPLADSIIEGNMQPIFSPSWDAHYRGWREYAGYWYDRHPPVVPHDPTWERWRDVEAVKEGRRGNIRAYTGLMIASEFGKSAPIRDEARELLDEWRQIGLI